MSLTDEDLRAAVMAVLSPETLCNCAVYVALTPVASGSMLEFPQMAFTSPWDALMAFVDLDPMANWSHPALFVLVSRASGEVRTVDAHLPPFRRAGDADPYEWRVLYRAPSVPDAVLAAAEI
ncbi:MAG: hypothetical protein WBV06_08745 [Acidimicrobiia bacterium]